MKNIDVVIQTPVHMSLSGHVDIMPAVSSYKLEKSGLITKIVHAFGQLIHMLKEKQASTHLTEVSPRMELGRDVL